MVTPLTQQERQEALRLIERKAAGKRVVFDNSRIRRAFDEALRNDPRLKTAVSEGVAAAQQARAAGFRSTEEFQKRSEFAQREAGIAKKSTTTQTIRELQEMGITDPRDISILAGQRNVTQQQFEEAKARALAPTTTFTDLPARNVTAARERALVTEEGFVLRAGGGQLTKEQRQEREFQFEESIRQRGFVQTVLKTGNIPRSIISFARTKGGPAQVRLQEKLLGRFRSTPLTEGEISNVGKTVGDIQLFTIAGPFFKTGGEIQRDISAASIKRVSVKVGGVQQKVSGKLTKTKAAFEIKVKTPRPARTAAGKFISGGKPIPGKRIVGPSVQTRAGQLQAITRTSTTKLPGGIQAQTSQTFVTGKISYGVKQTSLGPREIIRSFRGGGVSGSIVTKGGKFVQVGLGRTVNLAGIQRAGVGKLAKIPSTPFISFTKGTSLNKVLVSESITATRQGIVPAFSGFTRIGSQKFSTINVFTPRLPKGGKIALTTTDLARPSIFQFKTAVTGLPPTTISGVVSGLVPRTVGKGLTFTSGLIVTTAGSVDALTPRQGFTSRTLQPTKLDARVIEGPLIDERLKQPTDTVQRFGQSTRLRQPSINISRSLTRTTFRRPTINIVVPTPRPPTRTRIPFTLLRGGSRRREGRPATFGVEVRRGGKFRSIASGLSLQRAIGVGRTRVSRTLAATFRVIPERRGSGLGGIRTPAGFRRTAPLTFVERRRFRLSRPREVQQIQLAKGVKL